MSYSKVESNTSPVHCINVKLDIFYSSGAKKERCEDSGQAFGRQREKTN